MTDDYTVGIALALDNGVSEGLASIYHEFSTLNGVIDSSAAGLKQLAQIANQLRVGTRPPQVTPDAPWSPIGLADGASIGIASSRTESGSNPANDHRHRNPVIVLGAGAPDNASVSARSGAEDQSTATPRSDLQDSRVISFAPPPNLIDAIDNAAPSHTAIPPARILDRVQTWLSQLGPATPGGNAGSMPSHKTAELGLVPPVVEPQSPNQLTPDAEDAGMQQRRFSYASVASSPARSPMKLITTEFEQARIPQPAVQSAAGLPFLPPVASPSAQSQESALQGDIYLDGALLGKWVVEHLTRSMDRPRAGVTGFDPRLTATWPGAPTGT